MVDAPTCPTLVFINSNSGGGLGLELTDHIEELLRLEEVYDLSKHSPAAVLQHGVRCLDRMTDSGECARQTRQYLRGGAGAVGWLLSRLQAHPELFYFVDFIFEEIASSSRASATESVPHPLGLSPLAREMLFPKTLAGEETSSHSFPILSKDA